MLKVARVVAATVEGFHFEHGADMLVIELLDFVVADVGLKSGGPARIGQLVGSV